MVYDPRAQPLTRDGFECLDWVSDEMIEHYRDVTNLDSSFGLLLEDCWRGLEKGIKPGWGANESRSGVWGHIDLEDYISLGFICPFVVIDPTYLRATTVVAPGLMLDNFLQNPTQTQNLCLFTVLY